MTNDNARPQLRPILPGPSPSNPSTARSTPTPTPAPFSRSPSHSGPATRTVQIPKRTTVKTACEICRKRKVKCDGDRPFCSPCRAAGQSCQYRAGPGESSTAALKRKHGELEGKMEHHQKFYDLLSTLRADEAEELFRQVRAGRPISAIVQDAEAGLALASIASHPPPNRLGPVAFTSGAKRQARGRASASTVPLFMMDFVKPRPRILSGYDSPEYLFEKAWQETRDQYTERDIFVDIPGYVLPVSRWTTVSDDDRFLSHLLLLFWTWDTLVNRLIDRTLFEEDLKLLDFSTIDTSSNLHFCSPFLVNSILAVACLYSSNESTWDAKGNVFTRGRAFAREAERLLLLEDTGSSLTVIQGIGVLYIYEGLLGNGTKSMGYHKQLQNKYLQLSLPSRLDTLSSGTRENRVRRALTWIQWGFYMHDRRTMHIFCRRFVIKKPDLAKPWQYRHAQPSIYSDESTTDHWWFAYPLSYAPQKSLKWDVFDAECNLTEIAEEILEFLNPLDGEPAPNEAPSRARSLYNKLVNWRFSLPERLRAENSVLPTVLVLHTEADLLAVSLLRPFDDLTKEQFGPFEPSTTAFTHASNAMATTWVYRAMYSLGREYWFIPCSSMCAFRVLFALDSGYMQMETLIKSCQALAELGQSFLAASDTLVTIQAIIRKENISLPSTYALKQVDSKADSKEADIMRHSVVGFRKHGGQIVKKTILELLEDMTLEDTDGSSID